MIFWDADITGRKDMLEKMLNTLEESPSTSYCYSNFQFSIFNFQKKMRTKKFNVQDLQKNNYIHSTSLIRRKDAIRWDESLKRFQDWDLWLTMAENEKTGVWVDEYLFKIISRGTMSRWLPSFCYNKPFCWLPFVSKRVLDYDRAKGIIQKKHYIQ